MKLFLFFMTVVTSVVSVQLFSLQGLNSIESLLSETSDLRFLETCLMTRQVEEGMKLQEWSSWEGKEKDEESDTRDTRQKGKEAKSFWIPSIVENLPEGSGLGSEDGIDAWNLVFYVPVLAFALAYGFRMGTRPQTLAAFSFPQLDLHKSLSEHSTATDSPQTSLPTRKFSFEDFSLDEFASDQPQTEEKMEPFTVDCLETGRMMSNFGDFCEISRSENERVLIATHVLEEKRYVLQETTILVSSLSAVPNNPQFQHIQARMKQASNHLVQYITCWIESSPAESDLIGLKIIAQIERFSELSIKEFVSEGKNLSRAEVCGVLRKVLKAALYIDAEDIHGYDFSLESIYIDRNLGIKVGDCDGKGKRCVRVRNEALEMSERNWNLSVLLMKLSEKDGEVVQDFVRRGRMSVAFTASHPQEAGIILTLMSNASACEVLNSPDFKEWAELSNIRSPLHAPIH